MVLFGLTLTQILAASVVGMVVGALYARYKFVKWRDKFMQREQVSLPELQGLIGVEETHSKDLMWFLRERAYVLRPYSPYFNQVVIDEETDEVHGIVGTSSMRPGRAPVESDFDKPGIMCRFSRLLKALNLRIMCYEPKYEDVIRKALKDAGANFCIKCQDGNTSLRFLLLFLSSVSLMALAAFVLVTL